MNYCEAIHFLNSLGQFGMKPGLETTRSFAERVGNPQSQLRFIHVAGTNGKGSTCAFIESIYRSAGLRVGLYTSPHLVSFRERISVSGECIHEADVARFTAELRAALSAGAPLQPTFFEFVTVMALRHFVEQQCDLVIWETGLGGRLDATNIVTPIASVITNIALDHTQWLGDTLAKVAAEKAGIIKPGVPVIKADDPPEVMNVVELAARANGSTVRIVTSADRRRLPLDRIDLPLLGEHQRLNAAVALATVEALLPVVPVSTAAAEHGLRMVRWPGRLQLIRMEDGREVLLDGAHNLAGAEVLRTALAKHFSGRPPALLLGMLADKDLAAIVHALVPLARRVYTVPVGSTRTLSAGELATAGRIANPAAEVIECTSAKEALCSASHEPFLVVTGSLYLVGEVLELLGQIPAATSERLLNEFQPTSPSQ